MNSQLQAKLGRRDVSETDLVKQAFSDKAPETGKPRLRFTEIGDEQTAKSMQGGVLEFGSGCFRAIRNPVGHLPDDELDPDEQTALERLCALSLFAR
ncbi:TIGR02391 family protein [Nocardia cyriacigeorgica]|uniref:TIGR02391 family protein n=1 Tax=Nocardia cyriacigeorgica TaxID=135487 RepID=UPI0024583C7F|nr:TIGR02391 family protein [Nocardia cyriacigeorgica]